MSIIDEIWVIHLQKVDTLLMIGFVFIKDCLPSFVKMEASFMGGNEGGLFRNQ
jgi:hypothetical protein